MKLLTLVRHAKSSWKGPRQDDFDRPLDARGERDAPEMGRRLAADGAVPERLYASTALRAEQTARALARAADLPEGAIEWRRDLYLAGGGQLLECVCCLDPEVEHAGLVGHNPGITELLEALTRAGISNVPTCGLAQIELPGERWEDTRPGQGRLVVYDTPKTRRT